MDSRTLVKQLDEFQLIRCSLLPGELFTFIGDASDTWIELLENHLTGATIPNWALTFPAHIQMKVEAARVLFGFEIPLQYAGNVTESPPTFTVKGDDITRVKQEWWQHVIREKLQEMSDTECALFCEPVDFFTFFSGILYMS